MTTLARALDRRPPDEAARWLYIRVNDRRPAAAFDCRVAPSSSRLIEAGAAYRTIVMEFSLQFTSRSTGDQRAVTLVVHQPVYLDDFNSWSCAIAWIGMDLPGKALFGATSLQAMECAFTLIRSVIAMESADWLVEEAGRPFIIVDGDRIY